MLLKILEYRFDATPGQLFNDAYYANKQTRLSQETIAAKYK